MNSKSRLGLFAALGICWAVGPACGTRVAADDVAGKTFDYVIVGGGTSGLVVANRLSQDARVSVLVIERGGFANGPRATVPYWGREMDTSIMINPTSAPIPGLNNQTVSVPVAAVVGGATVVNGMAYMRGAPADYNAWAELGNPEWSWPGLLPYFRRSTDLLPPSREAGKQWNITWNEKWYDEGPVKITIPEFQYPDVAVVREARVRTGVEAKTDIGAGQAPGLYWVPETIDKRDGTRMTSRKAYYDTVQSRKNLHFLTGSTVRDILIEGRRAKGVRVARAAEGARVFEVLARKEVILAAGAIQTPQLLQVSGIGPRTVLESAGINVKKNLPGVGANLQDHATILNIYGLDRQSFPNYDSLTTNATYNASAWAEYFASRTGPVAAGTGSTAVLFSLLEHKDISASSVVKALDSQDPADFLPQIYASSPELLAGFRAQKKVLARRYLDPDAAVSSGAIIGTGFASTLFLKPLSRGTVTLDPTNPHGLPVVQYNTMSNPLDASILTAMLRKSRSFWLSANSVLQSNFGNIAEVLPGSQYQTDEEIVGALRSGFLLATLAHMAGTCAMMPEKLGGCVDSHLRVHGMSGLRVVDASVMPLIVGGGLQATVYAIAEKAADLIKKG